MDPKQLRQYFEDPESAVEWLTGLEIIDPKVAIRNMVSMASCDPTLESFGPFMDHLSPLIRFTADPDMVLNNLERFFKATRSPLTLISLFQRDRMALPTLLEIFATSQYLCDMLINDPELFEAVRQSEGTPVPMHQLKDELVGEVDALEKESFALRSLRRFKRRQMLQIAFGDIIKKQSLEIVTRQISKVAEVVVEAALHAAGRKLFQKRGTPRAPDGTPAHFTILALGKLGGRELNYSSDIDLMFLYDKEGTTDRMPAIPNSQYFAELGREIVRLLTEPTELGVPYRVDMRLRPNGQHGSLAIGFEEALRYYDNRGRTWERQAFIKARPIAGNMELGWAFLKRLEPWIYRKFLTQVDIAGIRSLKRKIERNARDEGEELRNVKTGFGGIRDIEFMIQFLQLLHGGDLPQLRTGNTLIAIERLEKEGCLKRHESELLFEAYRFLRKIEHRLQIMFDLQTHTMPKSLDEQRKLAMRMGYNDMSGKTALYCFNADFKYMTNANRKMLNHLLIDAFQDDETAAEVDLLLDPEPEESRIKTVLAKYHFDDPIKAYWLLIDLADEKNPYLFARRCRHFLVAIAPELLKTVAATPDPMQTLKTLAVVADALGEKGGLWELFSFNPPSLRLFIRFCALAPFLTDLLYRDPGMLDGLMDSLVADKLPPRQALDEYISRLVSKAERIEPILSGFKNDMMLIVGARDVLGKSVIRETTGMLSDIAEFCLKQITLVEYQKMLGQYGTPIIGTIARDRSTVDGKEAILSQLTVLPFALALQESKEKTPCRFAIVGLGKFGGREMNYHSDLDLLFLFESEGVTAPTIFDENGIPRTLTGASTLESVNNQVFFSILAQRIVKRINQFGSWGKLYDVDLRLRPMGKSGSLATPLSGLVKYFKEGPGELWERQMLCKARVVFSGDLVMPTSVAKRNIPMNHLVLESIEAAQNATPLPENWVEEIRSMRKRLQDSSPHDDLKRGPGGTVDIEFIVQMLQLKYGSSRPGIRVPNTFDALEKLDAAAILNDGDSQFLRNAYRFHRTLESFLRLMNMPSTKQLPSNPHELKKLALLAGFESIETLLKTVDETTEGISEHFNRIFQTESV